MKNFTKKIMLSIFSISFMLLSCGESKEKRVDENGNVIENSAVPTSKFESAGFIEKYNKYIDFGNSFHSAVYKAYERYFKWADIDEGPKVAKRVGGVYTLPEYSLKNLKESFDIKENIEGVDGPMKVVYEKAKVLFDLIEEADGYYDKQDYKDDDFAKGESLHKKMVTAFEEYYIAYSTMDAEFSILRNELFEYDAAKFKEENLLIKYNLMMSLYHSEGVLNVIGDLDGPDLKNLDLEKYNAQIAKFRVNFDELEKLIKDENQIIKEYGDSSINESRISSFIRYGNDFITQTRNLKERVEKKDFKYGITHPSIPAKGSPLKLDDLYSELIDEYNGLN